jgi:hypothetical protein
VAEVDQMTNSSISFMSLTILTLTAGAGCTRDVDPARSGVSSEQGGGGGAGGGGDRCTLTQGYWKNHEEAWPVNELRLGQTIYTKAELLAILRTPTSGNGLISMSHQLIAARLNIAAGAAAAGIQATLDQADALIGALVIPPKGTGSLPTSTTSAVNDALTAFNEGGVGPGHCKDGPPRRPPPRQLPPPPGPTPPDAGTAPPTFPPGALD